MSRTNVDSLAAAREGEAASKDERSTEACGRTDSCVTPAEALVLDLDEERDRFLRRLGLLRTGAGGCNQARRQEHSADTDPGGWGSGRVHAVRCCGPSVANGGGRT